MFGDGSSRFWGDGWRWRRRGGSGLEVTAAGHELVVLIAAIGVDLRLGKELLRILRLALGQHFEPVLREQVILHFGFGGG